MSHKKETLKNLFKKKKILQIQTLKKIKIPLEITNFLIGVPSNQQPFEQMNN